MRITNHPILAFPEREKVLLMVKRWKVFPANR